MAKKSKKVAEDAVTTEVVEATEQAIAVAKSRGPRGVKEDAIITVRVANPKREGSQSHTDFAQYTTGMTVGAFCDAVGKRATPHLVYDAAHGFITIEGYDPTLVVKKEKVAKEPKAAKAPREPRTKKFRAVAPPVEATAEQTELEAVTVEESLD